ncbi:MAG: hypothetical protein QXO82_03080 [Candidatus Methanomethylicia archaeon]
MDIKVFSIEDHISKIADWFSFTFFVILSFTCLMVTFNVYCFLAMACVSLFSLPKMWLKSEFKWRFIFFLLAGVFFIALFVQFSAYAYIPVVAIPLTLSTLLFVDDIKWIFSRYIISLDLLFPAIFLTVIVLLAGFGFTQLREHLIGIAGTFIMLFMLRHVCAAMNRTTLLEVLLRFKDIKKPADFIEEILKKSDRTSEEEIEFVRFRFNEFLNYIERGEYEQAYVTLATGTLEFLRVWDEKKNKEVWAWESEKCKHDDLRGAIVHSTPKDKEKAKIKEDLLKDLKMKRKILKHFRRDPFTPIRDLLEAVAKKYL